MISELIRNYLIKKEEIAEQIYSGKSRILAGIKLYFFRKKIHGFLKKYKSESNGQENINYLLIESSKPFLKLFNFFRKKIQKEMFQTSQGSLYYNQVKSQMQFSNDEALRMEGYMVASQISKHEEEFVQKIKILDAYCQDLTDQRLMDFSLNRNGFTSDSYINLVNIFEEHTKISFGQLIGLLYEQSELKQTPWNTRYLLNERMNNITPQIDSDGLVNLVLEQIGFQGMNEVFTYDLEERVGKFPGAYAFPLLKHLIVNPKTFRNFDSYTVLIHEIGHLVHAHKLHNNLQDAPVMMEAIAHLFELLLYEQLAPEVQELFKLKRINDTRTNALFGLVETLIHNRNFENPSQIFIDESSRFNLQDGEFESSRSCAYLLIPHYSNSPTYFPVYLVAELIASTIINQIKQEQGTALVSEVGEILQDSFYDGMQTSWFEKLNSAFGTKFERAEDSFEFLLKNYKQYWNII